jgi:hypothetical protein
MIKYAGLFFVFHLLCALVVGILIAIGGISRPPAIGIWAIAGAGYLMCYIFVRRQRRLFTGGEKWKLIGFCAAYLNSLEIYEYFFGANSINHNGPMVALGCLMDITIVILLFEFGAPRLMRRYLER